ncbi:hypothetical protein J4231_02910 [Candidatus Woesearchaeota archaeon]|nr:hypothetical protein [Candidatus Woesearchaeota archaeon]
MKKKGSSLAIETILLIGFVVIGSVGVYMWARSESESEAMRVAYGIGSRLQCADIKIDFNCDDNSNPTLLAINNIGIYTIDSFLIRYEDVSSDWQSKTIDNALKPFESLNLNDVIQFQLNQDYEITPLVKIDSKLYMCKEKGIVAKCS